jgi:hypothetical protein
MRVAADFPNVKFEHAGGHKTAPNLSTYNARFHEGRYLAGIIAGHQSASGVVGCVAGFPVPEVAHVRGASDRAANSPTGLTACCCGRSFAGSPALGMADHSH